MQVTAEHPCGDVYQCCGAEMSSGVLAMFAGLTVLFRAVIAGVRCVFSVPSRRGSGSVLCLLCALCMIAMIAVWMFDEYFVLAA